MSTSESSSCHAVIHQYDSLALSGSTVAAVVGVIHAVHVLGSESVHLWIVILCLSRQNSPNPSWFRLLFTESLPL